MSEQLMAICLSGHSTDKFEPEPEAGQLKEIQNLVEGGARLSDEELKSLAKSAEAHAASSREESSAGDLNWAYESHASSARILAYMAHYQKLVS